MRTIAPALTMVLLFQSCGWDRKPPPAVGFVLDVAKVPAPDPLAPLHSLCGDSRYVIITAVGNGQFELSGEAGVPIEKIVQRVREIMRYRAKRLVFVEARPDLSWEEFAAMLDRVWPETDVVSIITPKIERLARDQHCLAPSCGRCESLRSRRPVQ